MFAETKKSSTGTDGLCKVGKAWRSYRWAKGKELTRALSKDTPQCLGCRPLIYLFTYLWYCFRACDGLIPFLEVTFINSKCLEKHLRSLKLCKAICLVFNSAIISSCKWLREDYPRQGTRVRTLVHSLPSIMSKSEYKWTAFLTKLWMPSEFNP